MHNLISEIQITVVERPVADSAPLLVICIFGAWWWGFFLMKRSLVERVVCGDQIRGAGNSLEYCCLLIFCKTI